MIPRAFSRFSQRRSMHSATRVGPQRLLLLLLRSRG
jgi:hypothetical protein